MKLFLVSANKKVDRLIVNSIYFYISIMPQKKSVKTLLQLCVDNVIEGLERGLGKDDVKVKGTRQWIVNTSVAIDPEISPSPLDQLPMTVIEEVIRCLKKKEVLELHLELVITPQVGTLDLSSERKEDYPLRERGRKEHMKKQMFQNLRRAAIRCPMLKNLILTNRVLEEISLIASLPTFQYLQVLQVSNTSTGDKCMWILGTHCKHLRNLDVRFCWEVTDFGIQGLCLDYTEKENDGADQTSKKGDFERRESCTPPRLSNSLQTLCLEGTQITKKGIQEALQKLRSLKALEHNSTVKVLCEMHREDWEKTEKRNKIPKYALSKINFAVKDNQKSKDRLCKVVSLCPSITKLFISKKGLNEGLKEGRTNNIREMENIGYRPFTFNGDMVPLLNIIGNSLTELSLCGFDSLNICSIIDCCPNLRQLKLSNSRDFSADPERHEYFNIEERKTFEQLEKLTVSSVNISPENLFTLMSSSSLKLIVVEKCKTFNDEILQQASDLHSFPNLEYLELNECDFVTVKGLNVLLSESNPLKEMKISSKDMKSLAQINKRWKQHLALENWELNISHKSLSRFQGTSMFDLIEFNP
ncbi:uncharacterized protein LOC124199997 [Daphnia pulex]|uniref:uncharacterized protein LOC124199997 n=1 Tax=Daphnia pulex TaxID=6669 RepID=UPI001EDE6BA0|nr:uncharacterized protein LOC124199997 [Daphnia pulex]